MKKLCISTMLVSMIGLCGCFTAAKAYTKKTNADGVVTESFVSVSGTGDKASQIAAEGLFADGADDDLGAGVKNAAASQKSTGIDGTLSGMGDMFMGMAQLMSAMQTMQVPAAPPAAAPVVPPAEK